ncbi:MAG: large subunit ribosomal protein [Candidatus Eremiobacteraeota bacterium]|nr:large subunit ribosomal protein [Candidatus Eremiobacteraeota bacterium]
MSRSQRAVRGTVNLPHGTGRTVRVIAFARGDAARAAQEAGADVVGEADLILRSITLASTMGPGVKVDPTRVRPTATTA